MVPKTNDNVYARLYTCQCRQWLSCRLEEARALRKQKICVPQNYTRLSPLTCMNHTHRTCTSALTLTLTLTRTHDHGNKRRPRAPARRGRGATPAQACSFEARGGEGRGERCAVRGARESAE